MPAFAAVSEAEVEAAVNSAGKGAVAGNLLIWFLCATAFLKVSQKIDSFMASLGVNVGHTGGSMLAEAMLATRGVTSVAGFIGGGRHTHSGVSGSGKSSDAAGGAWPLKGGLAGVVSRKITSDAVKTATTSTSAVHSSAASTSAEHQSVSSAREESAATRSEHAEFRAASAQTASHTARTSAEHRSSQTASTRSHQQAAFQGVGLGGALFAKSLQSGGSFANDVIGRVAKGDIRSTGSITGELASQALASYGGLTAMGDAAPKASFSDVEIGGGRITGTEYTPAHPDGIAFGMYHTEQYTQPDGDYQKVTMADGSRWYKQYAADAVVKTPFKAPDGGIDYYKDIAKRLPDPPKRKDRI